jgi:dihydroflavonol-4-reductase
LLVDGGRAPFNVVWVDHVVDVILRAAARTDLAGEAFNVMDEVDKRPPSVREVAEILAQQAGLPPPRLSLPFPVAMGLGHVVQRLHRLVGASGSPALTPFVVKLLSRDVIYDASKAVRVLGWKPEVSARVGLAREAARRRR